MIPDQKTWLKNLQNWNWKLLSSKITFCNRREKIHRWNRSRSQLPRCLKVCRCCRSPHCWASHSRRRSAWCKPLGMQPPQNQNNCLTVIRQSTEFATRLCLGNGISGAVNAATRQSKSTALLDHHSHSSKPIPQSKPKSKNINKK